MGVYLVDPEIACEKCHGTILADSSCRAGDDDGEGDSVGIDVDNNDVMMP